MDPVTALGAAGSVVGIATFGVQLSAAIYRVYTEIGEAKESLQAALDGIDSTAVALEKIHDFLHIEERNLKKGRGLLLFSNTAILGVKETAHKCLVIFWRIEATITNKSGPKFEQELLDRLLALKRDAKSSTEPPVFVLDRSLVEAASSLRNRVRWKFKGDFSKLEGYSRRLHQFQSSLTLMFSVVSLGAIQRSHQQENWKQTAAYNYIRGIAVQGNIYSIAAQFSDKKNPEQTSFSVINFGGKDVGSGQSLGKMSSEESLPFIPKMDQQRKRPSTLHDSHRPIPQNYLQPRSGEQMDEERKMPKGAYPPQSAPSVSRTAIRPLNTDNARRRPVANIVSPEKSSEVRALDRSTSRSGPKRQSTKPETNTTNEPGFVKPHFDNADIRFSAGAFKGDGQAKAMSEVDETSPDHGVHIGSHQGASRPRSVNTDFTSEGSSTAVPEAQTCVYIIKHGTSHAIPYRIEPGLRDTVNNALRLRPSQKSVYKKIASLSPENIAALQTVLDDGGITSQTRKLVQLNILQKSRFQIGNSKDATVLAIVEDFYPQRPWRDYRDSAEENGDYLLRRPSYPGPPPLGSRSTSPNDRFGPRSDKYLGSSCSARLVKRAPHHNSQDVSRDMMDRDDYRAAMTTYRVWIIQQHPSLKERGSGPLNWEKCTVIEDFCNQEVITERLNALDKKPPSVNMKRLSLRPDQQTQISCLHKTLIDDETDAEYQWGLRQLDLIRSKSKPFQLVPIVTAIFVYLARTPRAHVNLERLFEMQHITENDDRPAYFSTAGGAQPWAPPQPSPYVNNDNPFTGQPRHRPNVRIAPPPPQSWDHGYAPHPPLPPDAPYNPHGPPAGFPPPPPPPPPATRARYGSVDRRVPPHPRPGVSRNAKQREFTDDSTDSDSTYETSIYSEEARKKQPKKQETRIISRLGRMVVVLKDLDEDQVEEILKLSEDRRPPEDELKFDPANQSRPRGNVIDDEARLSALQLKTVGRQDRSFERVRAPHDEGHSRAVAAADPYDDNIPRRLPYQQRSLLHDSKLRRKQSDIHLRSSAIARLGIPEAEARVALEASRVLGDLERSISDLDLAERRPFYPSQFDNTPYDPQRNADDRIINQLLVEWTPQGIGVPRGNEAANTGMRPGDMVSEEPGNFEECDGLSESSAVDDEDDDPWGSIDNLSISSNHGNDRTAGTELNDIPAADQDAPDKSIDEEEVNEESAISWQTESTVEIARLEERLATLKSMREGKKARAGLMSRAPEEKTEQGITERLAAAITTPTQNQTQTQKHPATAERDKNVGMPFPPIQPTIQRRVTIDEVQDETDTKKLPETHNPPAEPRDGGDRADKPARASTFPKAVKTSEAEQEWAQRVLEDSTAFSEPADPARAEIRFGSPSRRSLRAAQRGASSKGKESDRRRLRKRGVE